MRKTFLFSHTEENELINLTPLLDVLFVILILFILIAPLLNLDRISLAESTSKTLVQSAMNEQDSLNIFLAADGSLTIKNKKVEKQTLRAVLTELHKQNKQITPRLFIDKQSSFGAFTETKDLIENCGFDSLDLVVKSKHS
ncbi:MAG: Tol-Pal system protein TolR [Chlamydiia bacterium]|nr:Tol-Pal system protein TolR [Chlamydiia bacterium]